MLRRALFPPQDSAAAAGRPMPNFAEVHRELRGRHVTKMLLWQEYREQHSDGLGYSQFCEHYAAWAKPLLVMSQKPWPSYTKTRTILAERARKTNTAPLKGSSSKTWRQAAVVPSIPRLKPEIEGTAGDEDPHVRDDLQHGTPPYRAA